MIILLLCSVMLYLISGYMAYFCGGPMLISMVFNLFVSACIVITMYVAASKCTEVERNMSVYVVIFTSQSVLLQFSVPYALCSLFILTLALCKDDIFNVVDGVSKDVSDRNVTTKAVTVIMLDVSICLLAAVFYGIGFYLAALVQ